MSGWGIASILFGGLSLLAGVLQGWAQDKEQDRIIDEKVEERFTQYLIENEREEGDH